MVMKSFSNIEELASGHFGIALKADMELRPEGFEIKETDLQGNVKTIHRLKKALTIAVVRQNA